MESVIKWQTGEPKEVGAYIVTLEDNTITPLFWERRWCWLKSKVLAWCPLSEIEPYKEENEEEKAIPPYMDYDVRTK